MSAILTKPRTMVRHRAASKKRAAPMESELSSADVQALEKYLASRRKRQAKGTKRRRR